jgi:LCP family protein required for cell wall assembly
MVSSTVKRAASDGARVAARNFHSLPHVISGADVAHRSGTLNPARRSPITASILSFVWPGLGQAYVRRSLRGAAFAIPPAVFVAALAAVVVISPQQFALRLLVPTFALAVLSLLVVHALWRSLAIIDAWLIARRMTRTSVPVSRDSALAVVTVLVALMLVTHGLAGVWIESYNSAAQPIFNPPASPAPIDDIISPNDPNVPDGPPSVGLPAAGPINVLFVGVDSGPGRTHALTDSIMLVSYDRDDNQLAMISVPRDTGRLPFYGGGTYKNRVNSLMGNALRNPDLYPDGPIGTLVNEIAYVMGIPIQYYAVVDMAGFAEAVDTVGGVDMNVPYPIVDDLHRFYLDAGDQHLDGATTLLYARSRYGPNNDDYQRSRRQQEILRALVAKVKQPTVMVRAPQIMQAIAKMTRTNVPVEQLSEMLDLMARSDSADALHIVLSPSKYASRIPPAEVGGRFMTELKMDAVKALSIEIWGGESRYVSTTEP